MSATAVALLEVMFHVLPKRLKGEEFPRFSVKEAIEGAPP
jgi:hypothetical protein